MGVIKHQEHVKLRDFFPYYSRNVIFIYAKGIEKQPYTAKINTLLAKKGNIP